MATKKSTAIAKTKDNRPETGRGGKRKLSFHASLTSVAMKIERLYLSSLQRCL